MSVAVVAKRGRDWHMTDEEKRLLERVRGMYGSTGKSPRGSSERIHHSLKKKEKKKETLIRGRAGFRGYVTLHPGLGNCAITVLYLGTFWCLASMPRFLPHRFLTLSSFPFFSLLPPPSALILPPLSPNLSLQRPQPPACKRRG